MKKKEVTISGVRTQWSRSDTVARTALIGVATFVNVFVFGIAVSGGRASASSLACAIVACFATGMVVVQVYNHYKKKEEDKQNEES